MSSTSKTPSDDRDIDGTTNPRLHIVTPPKTAKTKLTAFRSEGAADMGAVKHLLLMLGAIALIAGGVHIDQELMLPAIDRTMRVENGVAEVVALLFAALAAAAGWNVGKAVREISAYGWGVPAFWANLFSFVLIGAGFFAMRLLGGSGRTASSPEVNQWGLAFVLLASYVAVGLLASAESYYLINPALTGKLRAQRRVDRLASDLREAEAKTTETTSALQTATYRQEAVHREYAEALEATQAVAAGARDYARLLIAASFGNPAQTGLVFDRFHLDEKRAASAQRDGISDRTGDPTNEIEENTDED